MNFKKIASFLLALLLCISMAACAENADTKETTTAVPTAELIETTTETQSDVLEWVQCEGYELDENQEVKNIILMIGDGMGENILTNAEIVKGSKLSTSFMPHKCHVGTTSLSGVTDSAAASTALSCGVKTKNRYIGVDQNGDAVETIVEFAKARGLKTGLIDTHVVPHATPAGMVAHNGYRGEYNEILKGMIKAKVDVMLGGGAEYAETPKMQARIEDAGYTYITTAEELNTLTKGTPALGCFAFQDFTADDNPSLTSMTSKALELLEGDEGFFLMVEASHIDIFEAELDMDGTLKEMQAFDKAIDYTLRWAEEHPGTLVLVTADHETGGVIVPESGKAEDVNNDCFTSDGDHTDSDVLLFAAGAQSGKLIIKEKIENTDIALLMRKALTDTYGDAPTNIITQ